MITPLYQSLGPLGWKRAGGQASIYSLASHLWKLDEFSDGSVSVPRLATIGGQNFTDNNTVASASKGVGAPANLPANVAAFVAASSESLSTAAVLPWDSPWSMSWWSKNADVATIRGLWSADGNNIWCYTNASASFMHLDIWGSGAPNGQSGYTLTNWHHFIADWDGANVVIYTDNDSGGVPVARSAITPTAGLKVGVLNSGFFYNGLISMLAFWPSASDSARRAALWNGGAGAPLP